MHMFPLFSAKSCTRLLAGAAAVAMLSGCANYKEAGGRYSDAVKLNTQQQAQYEKQVERDSSPPNAITRSAGVNLADRLVADNPSHRIPIMWSRLSINLPGAMTLREIAAHLSGNLGGIQTFIEGVEAAGSGDAKGGDAVGKVQEKTMLVGKFDGKTEALLDRIAAELDVTWKVNRDTLTFSYVDSKTYDFAPLLTSTTPETSLKPGITIQRWISDSSIRFLVSDSSV